MLENPGPGGLSPTVVGIAGTAKNTGKTTTLNEVIRLLSEDNTPFAVTSIGFDGEDFDTVTGLAKPRVFVPEGSVVATAQPLLKAAGADFQEIRDTGVRCALGRVFVGRVSRCGRVVLAGPVTTRGLLQLVRFLSQTARVNLVLVDGAFSRMAPLCLASHLIVATGAARNEDVSALAGEVTGIGTVMSLPLLGSAKFAGDIESTREVELGTSLMVRSSVPGGVAMLRRAAKEGFLTVRVTGPVSPFALEEFVGLLGSELPHLRLRFVLDHPVNLLVGGQASRWPQAIASVTGKGHEIAVRRSTTLVGFTLNPYRPAFEESSGRYRAEQVDAAWFLKEMRKRTAFPLTDLVLEGPFLLKLWMSGISRKPLLER